MTMWRSCGMMRRRLYLPAAATKPHRVNSSRSGYRMAESSRLHGVLSRSIGILATSRRHMHPPSQSSPHNNLTMTARGLSGGGGGRWSVPPVGSTTEARHLRRSAPASSGGKSQLYSEEQRRRKKSSGKSLTISDASQAMAGLRHRSMQLEPLPPVWVDFELQDQSQRISLFHDTVELLQRIETSVRDGIIRPSGKHGRELTHLLGNSLHVLCETPPFSEQESIFRHCSKVLGLLNDWNLDPQPHHYKCIIVAAARENLWKDAADLFSVQIDPDAAGYMPMDVSCSNPVGLYAIARYTQSEGGATAEQVMDAVLNMSMVSPTDQDKYVLAAGVALGLAGEWKSCVKYLESSYNSSRLGQPLVAAAMHACILCSRHNEALKLFGELVDGPLVAGSEWQWRGGSHSLDPACRDLAMRALGGSDIETENASALAVKLFREVEEEEGSLSMDALKGVVTACERDSNWEDAIAVLYSVIDRCKDPNWLIVGDQVSSMLPSQPIQNERPSSSQRGMGEVLCSVMRNCNASGRFGLALFCSRLVDLSLLSGDQQIMSTDVSETTESVRSGAELERSLLPLVFELSPSEDVLVSSMVSLCGLGCSHRAARLYEMAVYHKEQNQDVKDLESVFRWSLAEECYHFAQLLARDTDLSLEKPWQSAHRHVHRLTAVAHSIANSGCEVSLVQREMLASAVARAMRCCTAAGHPETGIHLAKRVEDVVSTNTSVSGAVSTFLGLGKWTGSNAENDFQFSNDSILAETIHAYQSGYRGDAMMPERSREDLLDRAAYPHLNKPSSSEAPSTKQSTQSANEALRTLIKERSVEDATALYREISFDLRNPETFCLMAKGLAKEQEWHHVEDIYAQSLSYGCLSEELALLAMKSIVGSNLDGKSKLRVLRSMVSDTAQLSGTDPKKWQYLRYWTLKRALGWYHARLLMWWNKSESGFRAELELAVNQFAERKASSLKPKNDVMKCIVNGVRAFNEVSESDDSQDDIYQLERSEWIELLIAVLDEASLTSLGNDPRFVNDVVLAFRALNCNTECIDYVRAAVNRGVQVTNTSIDEAIHAAETEGDEDFIRDLGTLFARVETGED